MNGNVEASEKHEILFFQKTWIRCLTLTDKSHSKQTQAERKKLSIETNAYAPE